MVNFNKSINIGLLALTSVLWPVGAALFAENSSSNTISDWQSLPGAHVPPNNNEYNTEGSQSIGGINSDGKKWSGSVRGSYAGDPPALPEQYGYWQVSPGVIASPAQTSTQVENAPPHQTPAPQEASSQLPVAPVAVPSAAQPSVNQTAGQPASQQTQAKKNGNNRKNSLKHTRQGKRSEREKTKSHYFHSQPTGKRSDKRMERHEKRTDHRHRGSQDKRGVYR